MYAEHWFIATMTLDKRSQVGGGGVVIFSYLSVSKNCRRLRELYTSGTTIYINQIC